MFHMCLKCTSQGYCWHCQGLLLALPTVTAGAAKCYCWHCQGLLLALPRVTAGTAKG